MKKYFYMAVAALAALSSCSSDDIIQNEGSQNENGVTTFTATIEGENTRATLVSMTPNWEAGDVISIDGHDYTADEAGSSTTLTGTGAVETTHHAYFPASLYNSGTPTLPASYQYEDGKFDMPMYAESTTTSLSFKNICGVLAITVPSTQMSYVTSIEVYSDKQMNGAIDNITAGGELTFATATPLTDANKKVTLTASSAVSTEGNTFYVPVPAATHNPLLITISDGTNTKAMVTKKSGGVEVARNNIYSITFAETPSVVWENPLTLGKTTATSIVIETGVAIPSTVDDDKKLNEAGTLWQVLDGETLKIQTWAPKIIGHGTFSDGGLFEGYSNATSITGLDKVDFSEVTDMSSMFKDCNALINSGLDLSSLNTSNVTNMSSMFSGCKALTSLNLSTNFVTSEVTDMSSMFNGCNALTSLNLSTNFVTSEVTDMNSMFYGCNALTSSGLNLSSFNTSKVTRMDNMFRECKTLTGINLSSFNTSNVTQMNNMFRDCNALTSPGLNLSNFDTSKVTTMLGMFIGCNTLNSLNLSNFDTQEVTDMSYMFYGCSGLVSSSFNLSSFNTSKVTTMEAMFYNCQKLNYLNLSHFNTSNLTNTYTMFRNCYYLQSLTLSNNFVMTNVTNKAGMFADCGYYYWWYNSYNKCKVYGASSDTQSAFQETGTNWSYMMFGD